MLWQGSEVKWGRKWLQIAFGVLLEIFIQFLPQRQFKQNNPLVDPLFSKWPRSVLTLLLLCSFVMNDLWDTAQSSFIRAFKLSICNWFFTTLYLRLAAAYLSCNGFYSFVIVILRFNFVLSALLLSLAIDIRNNWLFITVITLYRMDFSSFIGI